MRQAQVGTAAVKLSLKGSGGHVQGLLAEVVAAQLHSGLEEHLRRQPVKRIIALWEVGRRGTEAPGRIHRHHRWR